MRIRVYPERLADAVMQALKTMHFHPLAARVDVEHIRYNAAIERIERRHSDASAGPHT
jgi:hypothetical protein